MRAKLKKKSNFHAFFQIVQYLISKMQVHIKLKVSYTTLGIITFSLILCVIYVYIFLTTEKKYKLSNELEYS